MRHAQVIPCLRHVGSERHRPSKTGQGFIRIPNFPICDTQIIPCLTKFRLLFQYGPVNAYGALVIVFQLLEAAQVIACRDIRRSKTGCFLKDLPGLIRLALIQQYRPKRIQRRPPIRLFSQHLQAPSFGFSKSALHVGQKRFFENGFGVVFGVLR